MHRKTIMTRIAIIAALAKDNAIGLDNRLLYRLPDDLKRFKALTIGHTVIMGRLTFESLPKGALPNRRNIVLSHDPAPGFPGAECYHSLTEALNHCPEEDIVYIIGGSSVYKEAIDMADILCLTLVDDTPDKADAYFPPIDASVWEESWREDHTPDKRHAHAFSFVSYNRKKQQ